MSHTLLGVSSTDELESADCRLFCLDGLDVGVGFVGVESLNSDRRDDLTSLSAEIRLDRRTGTEVEDEADDPEDNFRVRLEIGIISSEDSSISDPDGEVALSGSISGSGSISSSSSLDDCDI